MCRFWFTLALLFQLALFPSAHSLSKSVKNDDNFPLPPTEFLRLLRFSDFEILSEEGTQHGMTGATKWTVSFAQGPQKIEVKWKKSPKMFGEGWNNSPRREIAAYKIQELFLDPPDYLVPPVASRCIPIEQFQKLKPKAEPNLSGGFNCVYGVLSGWLKNVTLTHPVLDKKRFETDRFYALSMANANLLCYLINHQDTVDDNFLISTVKGRPRVFSIDNGISFHWEFHNFFIDQLNEIRVPALPKRTIERLRKVNDADLEKLGVVEQLEADDKGILRHVEPGENFQPSIGSRLRGKTLQIGLTRFEIDKVKERIQKLLQEVDQGKWPLI